MQGLKRKVIRIRAEDSPNVRWAMHEIAQGLEVSDRIVVPGVKQYWEYLDNRRSWDAHQQCVSLDADWYEGADVKMYPPEWLNYSEQRARELRGTQRKAHSVGVDTGEGTAETAIAVVDELGLIDLQARRTPDTSVIPGWAIAIAREYEVPPDRVYFDQGGGGLEHADALRREGYAVRTVAFGATIAAPVRPRGVVYPVSRRRELVEQKYVYLNRRAEMYHGLRLRMNPSTGTGFAISADQVELRRQLSAIPLQYDGEGRIYLPPKSSKPGGEDKDKPTLSKLLGCSPDRADALVLAVYGLVEHGHKFVVRGMT